MVQTRGWLTVGLGVGVLTVLGMACSDDPNVLGTTATGAGGSGQGAATSTGGDATTSTSNGGSGQGGNSQGGAGASGGSGGAINYQVCSNPPTGYPAGPYGNQLGDVFEPLELAGWTNPTPTQRIDLETFGTYTMNDLRADHPGSFVMLHLSGMF